MLYFLRIWMNLTFKPWGVLFFKIKGLKNNLEFYLNHLYNLYLVSKYTLENIFDLTLVSTLRIFFFLLSFGKSV